MDCCIFHEFIGKCVETIKFNVGVTPATDFIAFIFTPMGKIYQADVTSDENGSVEVPVSILPDGVLNEYAGQFRFELMEDECTPVQLSLTRDADTAPTLYPYAYFDILGGNISKNTIGCLQ